MNLKNNKIDLSLTTQRLVMKSNQVVDEKGVARS